MAFGALYGLATAATLVVTSLDGNTDGLDDNLGYIAMFAIWGIGMTIDLPGDVVEDLRGRVVFLRR